MISAIAPGPRLTTGVPLILSLHPPPSAHLQTLSCRDCALAQLSPWKSFTRMGTSVVPVFSSCGISCMLVPEAEKEGGKRQTRNELRES